jgi:hypothetical protein
VLLAEEFHKLSFPQRLLMVAGWSNPTKGAVGRRGSGYRCFKETCFEDTAALVGSYIEPGLLTFLWIAAYPRHKNQNPDFNCGNL